MGYIAELSEGHSGQPDTLHIDFETKEFSAKLTVYCFEDNGYAINYIPALNLSGYGRTMEEARGMLIDSVLDDYSDSLLAMSKAAVNQELSKMGWAIHGRDMGNFKNAAYVDKDGVLRNFNLPHDTVIEEEVLTVA